ncbi:MAG TPA: peptidoglycan editing factor PgeF [Devosiaceae bacterium]|nr:peptidoglycan editing factor PgeF [Devosiaceae bacterium]
MSIPFEQSPLLSGIPGLHHGFFGRRGGHSTGDYASLNVSETVGDNPKHVTSNRADLLEAIGLPTTTLAQLTQVHSNRVVILDDRHQAVARPEADAIVTATPGVILGIQTADCTPILLADPRAAVIGAAHAGWKGALSGIIGNVVDAMVRLGAQRERLVAAIGPTISLHNYEVGPEFVESLLKQHRDAENRVSRPTGGREHFDLPGFVFDQLIEAGVGKVNDLGRCTYGNPKHYFSHRRATHEGKKAGRQISMIGLM